MRSDGSRMMVGSETRQNIHSRLWLVATGTESELLPCLKVFQAGGWRTRLIKLSYGY